MFPQPGHGRPTAESLTCAFADLIRSDNIKNFAQRSLMQDINPIVNKIGELKGRVQSLRGYL